MQEYTHREVSYSKQNGYAPHAVGTTVDHAFILAPEPAIDNDMQALSALPPCPKDRLVQQDSSGRHFFVENINGTDIRIFCSP